MEQGGGEMSRRWRRFGVLVVVALVSGALAIAVPAGANGGTNLIANGDFEAGNTGFYSAYTYLDPAITGGWTLGPEQMYTVSTNPHDYHSAWGSFGDHTSGLGKMMIVNGQNPGQGSGAIIWQQDLPDLECAEGCSEEASYPLYAGQTWEVGDVLIKNCGEGDAETICVKFVITDEAAIAEGWGITEAHVAIADAPEDIPNKNGNPIPGQFPISEEFDPVTETEWFCLPYDGEGIVAAHAKLELPELGHMEPHSFCAYSGLDTDLASGGDAAIAAFGGWGGMSDPTIDDFADWIWDAAWVTPTVADEGGLVDFVQTFNIVGTPLSATLKIAADNALAWHLNGFLPETIENLSADFREQAALGNFDWPNVVIDPTPTGWRHVYSYDVVSQVQAGANTLYSTAVNADWNTTSPSGNPAGLIYELCGTSEEYVIDRPHDDETGWARSCDLGEETCEFTGRNWATYIQYVQQPFVCNYRFTMWAASSHPTAPGQLRVEIDGDVLGSLNLTSAVGQWVKFEAVWGLSVLDEAVISIFDATNIAFGDDFVIDDISLVLEP
jgi:hypothetical protein